MKLGKRLVKAFCNKIDINIAGILGIVMTAVWFGNRGGRGSDWGRCTNFTKEQGRARIKENHTQNLLDQSVFVALPYLARYLPGNNAYRRAIPW